MKSSLKIAVALGAVLALTGCASSHATKPLPRKQAAYQSSTNSTVSLNIQNSMLVASVTTNWDPKANDRLIISWIAPANSYCLNSTFPITKAHLNADHSWAYRTLIHTDSSGPHVCNGNWTAQVMNVDSEKVLAVASYSVNVQAPAPTPAPTQTAAPAPANMTSAPAAS